MSAVQPLDLDDVLESLATLECYFAAVTLLVAQNAAAQIDQEIMEEGTQDANSESI